jgi:hypothetical protein
LRLGAQAHRSLCEALRIGVETRAFSPVVFAIAGLALLLADKGEVERAVELYATASKHPYVGKSRYREDIAGRQIAAAADALSPDVVTAARERGGDRELWATAEGLLAELKEQRDLDKDWKR